MLCDVVRRRGIRRRRRWVHASLTRAASHFEHKKRVAWVPISMHTCGSFFYNYGAPHGGPSGRRSSAINKNLYYRMNFKNLTANLLRLSFSELSIILYHVVVVSSSIYSLWRLVGCILICFNVTA